jgi:hypothetical protein
LVRLSCEAMRLHCFVSCRQIERSPVNPAARPPLLIGTIPAMRESIKTSCCAKRRFWIVAICTVRKNRPRPHFLRTHHFTQPSSRNRRPRSSFESGVLQCAICCSSVPRGFSSRAAKQPRENRGSLTREKLPTAAHTIQIRSSDHLHFLAEHFPVNGGKVRGFCRAVVTALRKHIRVASDPANEESGPPCFVSRERLRGNVIAEQIDQVRSTMCI